MQANKRAIAFLTCKARLRLASPFWENRHNLSLHQKNIKKTYKLDSSKQKAILPTGNAISPSHFSKTRTGNVISPTGKAISPSHFSESRTGNVISLTRKAISPSHFSKTRTGKAISPSRFSKTRTHFGKTRTRFYKMSKQTGKLLSQYA